MQKRAVVIVVILSVSVFSTGCLASEEASVTKGQDNGGGSSLKGSVATLPEIHIERATVLSIQTDPRAVESVLGSGVQYPGADVVTAEINEVRIENEDNVSVPANVTSGGTITLVFLRSTRPARVIRLPNTSTKVAPSETMSGSEMDSSSARSKAGSRVVSVNESQNMIVYYVRDPQVESRTVDTLPGLDVGDEFTTTAYIQRGEIIVEDYDTI